VERGDWDVVVEVLREAGGGGRGVRGEVVLRRAGWPSAAVEDV